MDKIHFYFQQIFLERANLFIIHHHHSAISLYTASRGFSFACILASTKSFASLVSRVVGFCRSAQKKQPKHSGPTLHMQDPPYQFPIYYEACKLTLNSVAVFKAFSASISTSIASERAFEALSRALCASRLR